jgi:hypothetical protein
MSDETYDNGGPITIWPPTTIRQTARERLAEAIWMGGCAWKRAHDPDWRGKPWMDGVMVDLDESDVVDAIVDRILANADPETEPRPDRTDR